MRTLPFRCDYESLVALGETGPVKSSQYRLVVPVPVVQNIPTEIADSSSLNKPGNSYKHRAYAETAAFSGPADSVSRLASLFTRIDRAVFDAMPRAVSSCPTTVDLSCGGLVRGLPHHKPHSGASNLSPSFPQLCIMLLYFSSREYKITLAAAAALSHRLSVWLSRCLMNQID